MDTTSVTNIVRYKFYERSNYEPLVAAKVVKLIKESGIDEPIDYLNLKYATVGFEDEKLIGIVMYGELEFINETLPRFLHIIIAHEYRRTRKALKMLRISEKHLRNKGFKRVVTYIYHHLNNKEMRKKYASKFGFKEYITTKEGDIMYKELSGGK